MTITIIKKHCNGGRSCGLCRDFLGRQGLPDEAHDKALQVPVNDPELLIECPKGAIMWRGDSDGERQ